MRHSWSEIVGALGRTLAYTYENLGLGSSDDAFAHFESLLRTAFPIQTDPGAPVYDLPVEDVFPLLDPKRCALDLNIGPPGAALAGAEPVKAEWVNVRPMPLCPVSLYHYSILPADATVKLTATARGYGQPRISWKVEGQVITGDEYAPTPFSFTAMGWDDDPYNPGRTIPATALVSGSAYLNPPGWNTSTLTIAIERDQATPAHLSAHVEVEVAEASSAGVAVTRSGWADVNTTVLQWDPPFDADRKRCADRLHDLMLRYTHLREIILLRTLPDPPPWMFWGLGIAIRVEAELGALAAENPELAAMLREQLGLGRVGG